MRFPAITLSLGVLDNIWREITSNECYFTHVDPCLASSRSLKDSLLNNHAQRRT